MARLALQRELTLARAPGAGRPRHLSAASGLARIGNRIYVIADDEHHLGVFIDHDERPGSLVRLRRGALPPRKEARKRRKPDSESLVVLPPFDRHPHGALFALGSGSRANRRAAVLLALNAEGLITGPPRAIGLTHCFACLQREFRDVNIEGAFLDGDHLALLQRGNKRNPRNARVRIPLAPFLEALAEKRTMPAAKLVDITDFTLGTFDGAPLSFTDGAALGGGAFAFTAVAEATNDSYADGACVAAAIGIIDRNDRLHSLWQLEPPLKVEGIDARLTDKALDLMVVTDADDVSVPAQLLTVTLR